MSYDSNPYAAPRNSYEAAAAFAAESERTAFIRRTYAHLGAAILAFAAIEFLLFAIIPTETMDGMLGMLAGNRFGWLIFLGGFMVVGWVARSWAQSDASVGKQYLGLSLYVVAEALMFMPLLYIANAYCGGDVIASAGVLTLIIFGGLTLVTMVTKVDFSGIGSYLAWGGILAMGVIVAAIFFQFSLGMWFSVAMIGLASGYILYDTSNVMLHYRTDQHVAASLALFASVAVLFWYVLRLLMSLNSRD
ncbi:MAG: Bax inhibitor-1 family protein [Pirellulaceae bacterium]